MSVNEFKIIIWGKQWRGFIFRTSKLAVNIFKCSFAYLWSEIMLSKTSLTRQVNALGGGRGVKNHDSSYNLQITLIVCYGSIFLGIAYTEAFSLFWRFCSQFSFWLFGKDGLSVLVSGPGTAGPVAKKTKFQLLWCLYDRNIRWYYCTNMKNACLYREHVWGEIVSSRHCAK